MNSTFILLSVKIYLERAFKKADKVHLIYTGFTYYDLYKKDHLFYIKMWKVLKNNLE